MNPKEIKNPVSMNDFISMLTDELGLRNHNMERNRPYTGKPWRSSGIRGSQKIEGITFRDLRDCFIRAICLSAGANSEKNMAYYREAEKGERAALCEADIYELDGEVGFMPVFSNMLCEVEKLMDIFPNIEPHDSENMFKDIPVIKVKVKKDEK